MGDFGKLELCGKLMNLRDRIRLIKPLIKEAEKCCLLPWAKQKARGARILAERLAVSASVDTLCDSLTDLKKYSDEMADTPFEKFLLVCQKKVRGIQKDVRLWVSLSFLSFPVQGSRNLENSKIGTENSSKKRKRRRKRKRKKTTLS